VDPQLLELALVFERECHYVSSSERLPTKVRFHLKGEYICDLFYRSSTGSYSYTLLRGGQRVLGWDNAPHHKKLDNFPNHFHPEGGGEAIASILTNHPMEDVVIVVHTINAFLVECLGK
jgi:hypothetical protein